MLGMKNHFDISDSIEIREVDIAGVTCIIKNMYEISPRYIIKNIYENMYFPNSYNHINKFLRSFRD